MTQTIPVLCICASTFRSLIPRPSHPSVSLEVLLNAGVRRPGNETNIQCDILWPEVVLCSCSHILMTVMYIELFYILDLHRSCSPHAQLMLSIPLTTLYEPPSLDMYKHFDSGGNC